jgi:hypothetical protein
VDELCDRASELDLPLEETLDLFATLDLVHHDAGHMRDLRRLSVLRSAAGPLRAHRQHASSGGDVRDR